MLQAISRLQACYKCRKLQQQYLRLKAACLMLQVPIPHTTSTIHARETWFQVAVLTLPEGICLPAAQPGVDYCLKLIENSKIHMAQALLRVMGDWFLQTVDCNAACALAEMGTSFEAARTRSCRVLF